MYCSSVLFCRPLIPSFNYFVALKLELFLLNPAEGYCCIHVSSGSILQ